MVFREAGAGRRIRKKEAPAPKRGKRPDDLPLRFAFLRKKAGSETDDPGRQRQGYFLGILGRKAACDLAGQDKAGARRHP